MQIHSEIKMENGNPSVGSPDCPIRVIVSVLHQDKTFVENWSAFATALDIPSVRIKRFRQDLLVDKITHFDMITEVLELWISNEGRKARLAVLLLIIEEECQADHAGASIRRHFNMASDKSDSITWKDLTPHLQEKVNTNLRNLFPKIDIDAVEPLLKDGLLRHLMKDVPPETIPEPLSYYINRTVLTRHLISTAIFDSKGSHIFLISGMERHELSKFAKDRTTDTSSNQIRQGKLSVKHIILESAMHFNKLCGLTNKHVHWLRYENNKLRWVQSRGGINLLQKHVERNQDAINEEDFCRTLKSDSNRPVCISDSPGMGKSVFLAQLGRQLRQIYPKRIVIFLVMNELVQKLKGININDIIHSIKDAGGDKITIELLLDGFDEVNKSDYKVALELLRLIKTSIKSIRLWVTSRLHLLPKLEQTLDTIGFNIQPFSKEDQVRFLTTFWSRENNNFDQTKLAKFANHCLDITLNSRDCDIAGIPLQCLLIAEVYQEEAVSFAILDEATVTLPSVLITSLSDLYEQLIEKKFQKGNAKLISSPEGNILMNMHVKLSLELLFPEESATFQDLLPQVDMNEILKVGVMESSSTSLSSSPRFIHRTFAEYFVAWFVVDLLSKDEHANLVSPAVRFFVVHVLACKKAQVFIHHKYYRNTIFEELTQHIQAFLFLHPVICTLLNSMISNIHPISAKISSLLLEFLSSYDTLNKISRACALNSLFYVLNLLISIPGNDLCKSQVFNQDFLLLTVSKSTLEFVKLAISQFEKYKKLNVQMKIKILKVAVRESDYDIVEYLLKDRHLSQLVREANKDDIKLLIHNSVVCSTEDSSARVASKIQVLRLLNNINPSLLNMKYIAGRTPLLVIDVHIRLMTELIRWGAAFISQDITFGIILHEVLRWRYSGDSLNNDFHSLLTSIPEEHLTNCIVTKYDGETPLMLAVWEMDPKPETLDIFKNKGANFNSTDEDGYSILHCAVERGRSGATIRKLIECGADVHWRKGWRRKTLLHYAVECRNTEAYDVLSEWIDVNVRDLFWRKPSYYTDKFPLE